MIKLKKLKNQLQILSWCETIEAGAMKQINNIASLPFAEKHIAIMPDCHQGYGMPIGAILATKTTIIPNAIGKDIGCGIQAIKTNITTENIEYKTIKILTDIIKKEIPMGAEHRKDNKHKKLLPPIDETEDTNKIFYHEKNNTPSQLGTLGGGNHFIEIQKDTKNNIWIMVHTGSRNLGSKVATHYDNIAKNLNKLFYSKIEKEMDLAFLPIGLKETKNYISEMNYCIKFAEINRHIIIQTITHIFKEIIKNQNKINTLIKKPNIKFKILETIDIKHNYAAIENHFNENLWIHRKGAILARKNTMGIIPGSQGTNSYIVKGKENKLSFNSCSHGAGRKLGRKKAQQTLNLKEEINKLTKQNIIHTMDSIEDLEEAPGAYKNIENIIKNQEDLITIIEKLTPIAIIKK